MAQNYESEETWTINLDKYERDNLLMLIRVVMDNQVPPFDLMHTGDWIGQIRWKLASKKQPDDRKETLLSNIDIESLKQRVGWWLEREKKTENDLMKSLVEK